MKKLLATLLIASTCLPVFAQDFTSSNLPIIIINTNGQEVVDDPKIEADMSIINNANGQRNSVTDPANEYMGKIGIEYRGQSSQMFPMKSYGIELRDNDGSSIDQSLFGLPAESDWILYAPYNEKTLMHNFLAYTLSRELGHWASNCRYVELVVNGEYRGIYVFLEKIKKNDGRVNIAKIGKNDTGGDKVTGGYIFSIDKEANGWFSQYRAGTGGTAAVQFSYIYPKETSIVQEQKDYIKSYVDSFENALYNSNFQDTAEGWRKFADEASFIDYLLVNEVSRNVDGYRISTYFHKDRNSKNRKIIAGPVWDYDLAFKNADYCNGSDTAGWAWQFNKVCTGDYWQVPFWWDNFSADTLFQANLLCRWQAMRQSVFSEQHLYHLIDSVAALTAEARQRHFAKWPVLGVYVWPNPQPIATTYQEEIAQLKTWLYYRLGWIDAHLTNIGKCKVAPPVPVKNEIKIAPNPVEAIASISISSVAQRALNITVYDISGRIILLEKYTIKPGANKIAINTSSWQHGVYTVQFLADDGYKVIKRVIK